MDMPETAGDISGNNETCQGYEEMYTVDIISFSDTYNWVLEPAEAGEVDEVPGVEDTARNAQEILVGTDAVEQVRTPQRQVRTEEFNH